jgi:hypothetical protein
MERDRVSFLSVLLVYNQLVRIANVDLHGYNPVTVPPGILRNHLDY